MAEKIHVKGNTGKKVHSMSKGTTTTDCGIWIKWPLEYLITNKPVTCKKCSAGCTSTHGMGRITKTLREK